MQSSSETFDGGADDLPFTDMTTDIPDNSRDDNGYHQTASTSFDSNGSSHDHHRNHHKEHANLNMCSAYTHVFADTLRSIAVIVAAVLAELWPGVTPEEADATAAVVVSGLILLSLLPLLQGLWRSVVELRGILAEERSECRIVGTTNGLRVVPQHLQQQQQISTSSSFLSNQISTHALESAPFCQLYFIARRIRDTTQF